jgi:hypothetical protein
MTTYTAPDQVAFRNKAGSLAEKITDELILIDAKIDEFDSSSILGELADGKIIVGSSEGVATDVDMSGDATIANTGAVTIAAEAVTLAKMADLARGSIISGQTTGNRPTALDAKTSGKILVGDGNDLVSVAVSGDVTLAANGAVTIATGAVEDSMIEGLTAGQIIIGVDGTAANNTKVMLSGDVTMAATGAVTIAAGAVEESMLIAQSADGLHAKRIARATYDFAVDGGAVGSIGLGVSLPDNAIITRSWYTVLSSLTSADSTATVALSIPTDDAAGIAAATALSANNYAAGHHEGIQTGTAANFSEQTTAARELTLTIGVQDLTAGKLILFCEYVVLV